MESEKGGKHRVGKSVEVSESFGEISMRCRLCGEENEDMIDIFRIRKMIEYCRYIKVEKADTLPKRVCQICFLKLELFYQFNQIVNKVDELFRASTEQGTAGIEQFIIKNKETERQTPDETDTHCASSFVENRRRNSRNYELEQNHVFEHEAKPGTSSAQQDIPESTSDSEVSNITASKFKAASRKLSSRQREQKSEDVRIEQKNSAVPERPCKRKARFECNVCSKTYATKHYLNGHKKLHSSKGLFTCSHCGEKFPFKLDRKRHYQSHMSRSLKHACKYCDKKFRSKQGRDFHYRFHKNESPFECAVCKKKFMQRYPLRTHAVVHSNERNHHCDLCEKSFKTPQTRDAHMKTIHTNRERFVCEHCKTECQGKYSLWQHLKMCEQRNP